MFYNNISFCHKFDFDFYYNEEKKLNFALKKNLLQNSIKMFVCQEVK